MVGLALQGQVAANLQPIADVQGHGPAQAGFAACHRQGCGGAVGQADGPLQRAAPGAGNDVELFGGQADTWQSRDADVAAAAQGVALLHRSAAGRQALQHQGATAVLQAGPQGPQAQAARQVGQAELQAGGLAGTTGTRGAEHADGAAEAAQTSHIEAGIAEAQLQAAAAVAKADQLAAAGPGTHALVDGAAQGVDRQATTAAEANGAVKALEGHGAAGIEGVPAPVVEHQGKAGGLHLQAGGTATDLGLHVAGPQQQPGRAAGRLRRQAQAEPWQGLPCQGADAPGPEATGCAADRFDRHLTRADARQGFQSRLQGRQTLGGAEAGQVEGLADHRVAAARGVG